MDPDCDADSDVEEHSRCRAGGTDPRGAPRAGILFDWRPGDWDCPACNDIQFARNTECRMCGEPRPRDGRPGAPDCPSDPQFARNMECRSCGEPRPRDGGGRYDNRDYEFSVDAGGREAAAESRGGGGSNPAEVRMGDERAQASGAVAVAWSRCSALHGFVGPGEQVTQTEWDRVLYLGQRLAAGGESRAALDALEAAASRAEELDVPVDDAVWFLIADGYEGLEAHLSSLSDDMAEIERARLFPDY